MEQKIGMIGLGRMGGNMARRIARAGLGVVAWDRAAGARAGLAGEERVNTVQTLADLVAALPAPRVVWSMLPAGAPTEATIVELRGLLATGDVIVDGANAYYRDSMRRAQELAALDLHLVDAGVSGGVWGLGQRLRPDGRRPAGCGTARRALPAGTGADRGPGWLHCGPSGAGHFAKMVHNGIEYGLMQAYAEGLSLLRAKTDLQLDVAKIAESWRHGTVIRSWLSTSPPEILAEDDRLESIAPVVADSGEGRWTAIESVETRVPTPVMTLALMERFASQGHDDFSNRVLARLRQSFGGHAVTRDNSRS